MRKLIGFMPYAALAVLGGAAAMYETPPDTDPISHAWNAVAMWLILGSYAVLIITLVLFLVRWVLFYATRK